MAAILSQSPGVNSLLIKKSTADYSQWIDFYCTLGHPKCNFLSTVRVKVQVSITLYTKSHNMLQSEEDFKNQTNHSIQKLALFLLQICSNESVCPHIRRHMALLNPIHYQYIDGLVQDCSNSIANTLELLKSCTKPLLWHISHISRWQGSCGPRGAHLGPVGPRLAPYGPHEPCYQGCYNIYFLMSLLNCMQYDMIYNSNLKPNNMMTSSNVNIFRVTGHLCGEFTGPQWIPHTKASDAELWCSGSE